MHNNVLTIEEIKQRSMICPQNNIPFEPSLSSLFEDLHQVAAFKTHGEKKSNLPFPWSAFESERNVSLLSVALQDYVVNTFNFYFVCPLEYFNVTGKLNALSFYLSNPLFNYNY